LFEPWEADNTILKESGIDYGVNYPKPIVSITHSRDIALNAFEKIKK